MRVALITNLASHYRKPLFDELSRRADVDFFFTSRGQERYWSADHVLQSAGLSVKPSMSYWRLFRGLSQGGYEAFVCSLAGRASLLVALAAAVRRRKPVVLWVGIWHHPQTPFHRLSRPFVKWLFRRVGAIVVYGSHVASYIATESGRTHRVFIAPQAVDNRVFRREAVAERSGLSSVVVGFVGRLEAEKGLDVLLQASRLVPDEITFRLIGSGSEEVGLRARVQEKGLSDRIQFYGYVPQGRLPSEMALLDILVMPSVTTPAIREAWGLVANEAMNLGLAVIATDAVGAAAGGLIVDRETGLVVPEGNAEALAAAIGELARDRRLRLELGERGREHVKKWTYDAAADGFMDAIAAVTVGQS